MLEFNIQTQNNSNLIPSKKIYAASTTVKLLQQSSYFLLATIKDNYIIKVSIQPLYRLANI